MTFSSGEASLGRISTASGGPIVAILLGLQNLFCRQRILPLEDISIEDIEDSNMWTVASPGVYFDHHVLRSIIYTLGQIAVSGPTEHCSIFHFPPPSVRHGRDIPTFLDNLMV